MENNQEFNETSIVGSVSGFFQSNTARTIMIAVLTLILLIPLEFVKSLISERSIRKQGAVAEVASMWGNETRLMGPVLKVPYFTTETYTETDPTTQKSRIVTHDVEQFFYCFPETLSNKTNVKMNRDLKRGLYKPVVFTSDMTLSGRFAPPNMEKISADPETIKWEEATVEILTSNLRSIQNELVFQIGEKKLPMEAGTSMENNYGRVTSSKIGKISAEGFDFTVQIKSNGSNGIQMVPVGNTTTMSMDADWPSPSFIGAFAAATETKKITEKNFHADWKIVSINRPFAQYYHGSLPDLNSYLFGVNLIETVDEYQQNERVAKYGFLVIGLTFLVFFLIQLTSKIKIHIFQYTMIGLALIMFYTLLISITEHTNFAMAYIIAAAAVIIMLVLYSASILANRRFSMFVAGSLGALYTYIYIIIQMENYALLAGSIGLFAILGAVMYFSRKIDWSK